MAEMLRPCSDVYQDINKEDKHELAKIWAQDVVHESLECHQRVRQAEGHAEELEQPFVHAERRLLHIVVKHLHLMVPGASRAW
jgi:hypothetical protein